MIFLTNRESQMRTKTQTGPGTAPSPASPGGIGFSQSMKDLTRPKPGFSPERMKAQHKSGSPVFAGLSSVQKAGSFTSRSLETLTRPKSAESPSLLPAIENNRNGASNYQMTNQNGSIFGQTSANQNASNGATGMIAPSMSSVGISVGNGTSSANASNAVGVSSGAGGVSPGNTPGNSVPKNYSATTTLLLPQYSIQPLLYLNNLLTVAKLDELRRNSVATAFPNSPYPLKTPAPTTAAAVSGLFAPGGGAHHHHHQFGVSTVPAAAPLSAAQNFMLSDLSPRKFEFDQIRKPTPSVQLPPISKSSFSCKECFFTTNQQSKLDIHIMTIHNQIRRQIEKPITSESQERSFNQSADGSNTHFDEHNTTSESNPNNDSGSSSLNSLSNQSGVSQKPFKCTNCSYSTIYENCLKSHQARHSTEFEEILQSTLLTEMKFGGGYKCTICNNYNTSYKKCLASHLLKHKKGSSGLVGPIQKITRPRSLSNKSSNSRSGSANGGAPDSYRRPTSGNSSVNYSDDDQCSSLLEATNRDLTIDEEGELPEFEIPQECDEDDDAPSSKRQNMRSSNEYMDVDEHRQVVTSTPDVTRRSDVAMRQSDNACPFCETIFKSERMFNVHMSFHSEVNPFTCKSCGEVCSDSYEFELHLIHAPH
ncbi:zinc finger protein 90-like isoform X2 [Symsagittifera roscoffensis]|uniref:zinc finger protein 90-like isoform X2 n=1 Tax=Symsagittifera roscoffensis TaxID=84072 RepID=UPI00307BCEF5